jgi:hypothetical protein
VTRIETGAIAAALGVVAAATIQVGEGTLGLLLTAVIVPLAGGLWREREKRLTAEAELRELKHDMKEAADHTSSVNLDVRMLKADMDRLRRESADWSLVGTGMPPYRSPRTRVRPPHPTQSRSGTRSRASARGFDEPPVSSRNQPTPETSNASENNSGRQDNSSRKAATS